MEHMPSLPQRLHRGRPRRPNQNQRAGGHPFLEALLAPERVALPRLPQNIAIPQVQRPPRRVAPQRFVKPKASLEFPDLTSVFPPTYPLPENTYAVCERCDQAQEVPVNIVRNCKSCNFGILALPENGMRYVELRCCSAYGVRQVAMSTRLFECETCLATYRLTTDYWTMNKAKVYKPVRCTDEELQIVKRSIEGPSEEENAMIEQELQKWKKVVEDQKKGREPNADSTP